MFILEQYIDYRDFEQEIKTDKSLNSKRILKIIPMPELLQKAFNLDKVSNAHTIGFNYKNEFLKNVSNYYSNKSGYKCYAYLNSAKVKGIQYLYFDLFTDRGNQKPPVHTNAILKLNYGVYAIIFKEEINRASLDKAVR